MLQTSKEDNTVIESEEETTVKIFGPYRSFSGIVIIIDNW
jgi:hypothetical protein